MKMSEMPYTVKILQEIINIPSPSGYTGRVMERIWKEVESLGFPCHYNRKGGLIVDVEGKTDRVLGLSAHADTLGAMVRSIRPDGTLAFASIGGFAMQSVEGSYCRVHTRDGREFTGTAELIEPSVHTSPDVRKLERAEENMRIRLDERVRTKEDVEDLDIGPGDFISFDPKFEYTEKGFIKSRHLDDKASVAVILGFLRYLHDTGKKPDQTLKILFSNYEEVGHGGCSLPPEVEEFLAIDMGAVGSDLSGDEYHVSICAKDSSGPYDFDMTNRLIRLAREYGIDYTVDVFPYYRSDASAALSGGNDIRCALIGQGVMASHGQERTHADGLEQTWLLLAAYTGVLEKECSRRHFNKWETEEEEKTGARDK